MLTLAKSAEPYFRQYVRSGGKQNRKKQVSRITEFLDWAEANEKVRSLHGLGKRHVINFWKANRLFSAETAYKYWLGIRQLWVWIGKHDLPPEPRNDLPGTLVAVISSEQDTYKFFDDLSVAIRFAREHQSLSHKKLANLTGLEASLLENIENGVEVVLAKAIHDLLKTLCIQFSIKTPMVGFHDK